MYRRALRLLILPLAILLHPSSLRAQAAAEDRPAISAPLITIGGEEDARLRLSTLLGRDSTTDLLLRSPSRLTPALPSSGPHFQIVSPEIATAWNSRIPFSLNDGSMWAGRGTAVRALAGVRARWGRVSLTLAPELSYSQNLGIDSLILSNIPGRSPFAPPWQVGRHSIDLPVRFGENSITRLYPGQSTLAVEVGPASFGASSESQWWGPGIRNALVMSDNAPGIPHLFVRTTRPMRTRLGAMDATWMIGPLTESAFFDSIAANDTRSLSAVAATLQPVWTPGLTVGLSRSVYSNTSSPARALGHVADAILAWPRERMDSTTFRPKEQIFSLFARWVFPADGLAVHGEWARYEVPLSLRDFIADPGHTQGFTGGLEWARPTGAASALRLQTEITYVEQDPSYRTRPTGSFYASRGVTQGYTQRGQVIGAAIGPGSSSQWIALDHFSPTWTLGVYGGRIRWQNDAYYDSGWQGKHEGQFGHDVTMFGGLRGSATFWRSRVEADLTTGKRFNFLYQTRLYDYFQAQEPDRLVDFKNRTLRITVTPFIGR